VIIQNGRPPISCQSVSGVCEGLISVVIFRSGIELGMFAVTTDTTGDNLPAAYAPWHELGTGASGRVFRESLGLSPGASRDLVRAVREDGYCLACSRSTFDRVEQDLKAIAQ
jgi:hypothetical protein